MLERGSRVFCLNWLNPDLIALLDSQMFFVRLNFSIKSCKNKLKMFNYTSGFKSLEKILHQLLNRIIVYLYKILIGGKAEEACS